MQEGPSGPCGERSGEAGEGPVSPCPGLSPRGPDKSISLTNERGQVSGRMFAPTKRKMLSNIKVLHSGAKSASGTVVNGTTLELENRVQFPASTCPNGDFETRVQSPVSTCPIMECRSGVRSSGGVPETSVDVETRVQFPECARVLNLGGVRTRVESP